MKHWLLLMALSVACTDSKDSGSDTSGPADDPIPDEGDDSGSPEIEEGWGILADEIGQGSLLSGWTADGITHMVGGDMRGGPGLRVQYDGSDLCIEADITERALWWIHGDRPGRWVAVGEAGTALMEEDGVRTRIDIPSEATFYGVWVTDTSVIAVGGHVDSNIGEVWRHTEDGWTPIRTDLPGSAFKIWENWIVGVGVSYQINADHELTDMGNAGRLLTVRGNGELVTAVGGLGSALVMQHDGSAWSEIDSAGLGQPLNGVWTAPGHDVWVVGNFGATGRLNGGVWDMPDWPVTSHHFHAVWPHSDNEMLFIGGNFMSSAGNFATIGRHGPAMDRPEVRPCE